MIGRGCIRRLKGVTLGALLVYLLLTLFSGQASAADEGSVEVGIIPNPLMVSVFAPSEVIKGEYFTVSAQIQNLGDERIKKTVATIHLDGKGLSLGKEKAEKNIGIVQPYEVINIDWQVEAKKVSTYIILISVSGKGATGDLTAQGSVIVTVKERRSNVLDFFQGWYRLFRQ